jgi:serine/threonine protein kinase
MPVLSIQEFLIVLRHSTLLTREQLLEVADWPEDEPKAIGERLVAEGVLTTWQVLQLRAGKGSKSNFFLGKYRLLECIGVGGMGAVYKAVQPGIARTVAIKKLNKQVMKQTNAVERFLREIRSAAAVDDPHIVRAYDANCDNDTYYLVMEYVPGKNLKEWVREQKVLPIGWSCECIRQAALGLQHAHELGMLHRDIKSSNLLVTQGEDGLPLVKLLDLGLARFASESTQDAELTRVGQVLGTPDYMAPEQARDTKSADIRSDIFSLGCTLFELLTGRFPYGGTSVLEKLMIRSTDDAIPVRTLRRDVPEGLAAVVAKMLARDPNQRYATPAELANALAPFSIGTAPTQPERAQSSRAPFAGSPTSANLSPTPSRAAPKQAQLAKGRPGTAPAATVNDPTIQALHAEIAQQAAERPAATAGGIGDKGRPWILYAAALAAAALILVAVSGMTSKRKGHSRTSTNHTHSSDENSETETETTDEAPDLSQASANDPTRRTALWVFKLGGTIEFRNEPGSDSPQRTTGRSRSKSDERHSARAVGELPTQKFEITAVHIRGPAELEGTDFRRLAKLTYLESLTLSETRFTESELAAFSKLESLQRLELAETRLTDAGLEVLKTFPELRVLDLSQTRITGAGLQHLSSLAKLTELRLEGTKISDKDLRSLQPMTQLVELNLARTNVQGQGLNALRSLKNLLRLDLSGLPMRDRALRHVSVLENLEVLRLTRAKVTDEDLKMLSGLSKLKEFVLASTQITGDGLKYLSWMSELERLDLQETFVGDHGLKSLKELTGLKHLSLRRTLVTDNGLKELQLLKGLESVDLAETKVTPQGAETLRKALPGCNVEM